MCSSAPRIGLGPVSTRCAGPLAASAAACWKSRRTAFWSQSSGTCSISAKSPAARTIKQSLRPTSCELVVAAASADREWSEVALSLFQLLPVGCEARKTNASLIMTSLPQNLQLIGSRLGTYFMADMPQSLNASQCFSFASRHPVPAQLLR